MDLYNPIVGIDYPVLLHSSLSVEIVFQASVVGWVRRRKNLDCQVWGAFDVSFSYYVESIFVNEKYVRLYRVSQLFGQKDIDGSTEGCSNFMLLKKRFQKVR